MPRAGDAGIKRLARRVDSSVRSLGAHLIDQVQPALQQAALLLSQLQGILRSAPHLSEFGPKVGHPLQLCAIL